MGHRAHISPLRSHDFTGSTWTRNQCEFSLNGLARVTHSPRTDRPWRIIQDPTYLWYWDRLGHDPRASDWDLECVPTASTWRAPGYSSRMRAIQLCKALRATGGRLRMRPISVRIDSNPFESIILDMYCRLDPPIYDPI